jgi:membrane associated rhomboid family serine protease
MERRGFFDSYTGWIILVNVAFFILFLIFQNFIPNLIDKIAIQPEGFAHRFMFWTIITSMFMHADFNHLIFNMLSLMFIGSFVERLLGKKRFLKFYFISGIIAGLLFVLVALITGTDMNVYAVGASGAIFGLGGLLAVLTPRLPVLVFFVIPMPMWAAMIGMLSILWVLSYATGLPIGNIAHLGGLLTGVAYGFYLKARYPKKTQMISNYFSK